MDTKRLRIKLSCLLVFFVVISLLPVTYAQVPLTIEQALDIAEEHNPDLKHRSSALKGINRILSRSEHH